MLITMRRVDIVAPRVLALDLLRVLHRAGMVELLPFEPIPGAGPLFRTCAGCPESAGRQARFRRASDLVGLLGGAAVAPGELEQMWELDDAALDAALDELEPIRTGVTLSVATRRELDDEMARLTAWREVIAGLATVTDRIPDIPGYVATAVAVEGRDRAPVKSLRSELETLTAGRCGSLVAELDATRTVAVLVYPARHHAAMRTLLDGREFREVTLPPDVLGRPLPEIEHALARDEARVADRRARVAAEIDRLRAAAGSRATALAAVLHDRMAEADAVGTAGTSEHLLELPAWAPATRIAELQRYLAAEVGPEAVVVPRPGERMADQPDPPVSLRNLPVVRAFEPLIAFVGLPRYGSLDPTPALAVTFPVFVGFMVGDAGYGLVLLAMLAAVWRRRRASRILAAAAPIALLAGLATVFFGVLFGEWFGDIGRSWLGLRPLWLDRAEAALPLLVASVGVGVAQVGLGLALGVLNAVLLRERRVAVARASLLCCLGAGLVLMAVQAGAMPGASGGGMGTALTAAAAASLAFAAVGLFASQGASGPIELVGMFGNVLSYARLMAIGLASVMLAVVANRLGGLAENVLVGVVISGVFHALNFGLAFFDASIQALRLHYVEFFSKFVEHGGRRFRPFTSVLDVDDGVMHGAGR